MIASPDDADRARQIAELEEALKLPLPDAARRPLEAELARLRGTSAPVADLSGSQVGDVSMGAVIGGEATVGVAVGGGVEGGVQTGGLRNDGLIQIFFQAAGVARPSAQQRELVADYLDGLAHRCDRLRLRGVVDWERKRGKAPDFTLSQVYVALAADEWVTVGEAEDQAAFADEVKAGDPDSVLPQDARRVVSRSDAELGRTFGEQQAGFRLQRPLLLTEAVSQRRRVVLLGGPGSGKSTFLRHLAVALARAGDDAPALPGWSAGPLLPVYASLGGFAAWLQGQRGKPCDAAALWRYLLAQSEHETLGGLGKALQRAFRGGRLLLMLDGLDEVADQALRPKVAQAVAALADRHEAFVVVTCRVRSFEGAVAEAFAEWGEAAQLALFALGQIRHFVQGWYGRSVDRGAFAAEEARTRAEALNERLAASTSLRELGQTPLLLTIITILHYYEGKLPEDRADLYEDMVQLLLTRWTVQRREAGAAPSLLERLAIPALKETQLRQALAALAYRAHQGERSADGRGLLDQAVVQSTFTKLFQEFGLAPGVAYDKALLVLSYLEDESGLLLHEGGERYAFPHLTYEEYLAGAHLVGQDSALRPYAFQQLAYEHWRSDPGRWREVILLALGHAVRLSRAELVALWLRFLLEPHHGERARDDAELQAAALFAAEGLLDVGGRGQFAGVSTLDLNALWARLAAVLAEAVEGTALPVRERVQAGAYLARLDDPRPGVCTLPPTMVPFPAGRFVIGSTREEAERAGQEYEAYYFMRGDTETAARAWKWPEREVNDRPVSIGTFELARYPVTNAQYRLFIEAGGYDPEAPWWNDVAREWLWRTDQASQGPEPWKRRSRKDQPEFWDDVRFGKVRINHPVVGVSWYEATAFCAWLTKHLKDGHVYCLPSEAEWEYAARGPKRRVYPWGGEEPDGERANYDNAYNGTTAVGCFRAGATAESLLDLAGNVWEWTRSEYRPYPYDPEDGREGSTGAVQKSFTLRGGSWANQPINLRAALRVIESPGSHNQNIGFRLVRILPAL